VKLWSFLADLEESLGTFATTKAVYDKIMELRVATPQIILNYATWLEEHKHFEESFKAYEKGVNLFNFPYVHDIWLSYLTKFVKRYGGIKLERARDLFEQVLEKVPAKDSKVFYVMYANLEEEYGLARHAMAVYDRACKTVAEEDRYTMYLLYINRATEFFGITHTREIFMRAIESLPEKYVKDMCLKFADMERKLGEIDRARSIYVHAAQYCDPRTEPGFWQIWYDFEKPVGGHGNEDTFREMLRIKRSIQAQYNTQVNIDQMLAAAKKAEAEEQGKTQVDRMKELEMQARSQISVAAIPRPAQTDAQIAEDFIAEIQAPNPEEIVIREPGEDEEFVDDDAVIEEVAVPSAVFGASAEKAAQVRQQDQERGDEEEEEAPQEEEEEAPRAVMGKRKRGRGK
jgi:pre-mRNA-splicing factor SYF1